MPRSMWFRGHAPYELEPLNPDKVDSRTDNHSKPLTTEPGTSTRETPDLGHDGQAKTGLIGQPCPLLHMFSQEKNTKAAPGTPLQNSEDMNNKNGDSE